MAKLKKFFWPAKVGSGVPMRQSVSSKSALVLAALTLAIGPTLAQDAAPELPSYQDDRSGGAALIQSFYNAINRGEYLRAWSYYGENAYADGTDPAIATGYEDFKKGYADTLAVTLLTGDETSEGAAGSTYTTVPVAIDATDKSGHHTQFAGCYILRLVQPAVQDSPPFHPLHIEKGDLGPAEGELESILPTACAD